MSVLRHVDHDPTAARAAALRCRDAAASYERIAATIAVETAGVAWWGPARDRTVADVEAVASDLRHEAAALRVTALQLEAAARAAEHAEAAIDAELAAAAAAAAVCPPTSPRPSVGQGPVPPVESSRSAGVGTSGDTVRVPTGVR